MALRWQDALPGAIAEHEGRSCQSLCGANTRGVHGVGGPCPVQAGNPWSIWDSPGVSTENAWMGPKAQE